MRSLVLRAVRAVVVAVPLVVGAVWVGSLAAVVLAARRDEARPAAAIIVLGAAQYDGRPSPVLRARLDHAIALWQRGLAPRLIVTGGRAAGDRTSEAATSRRYAVRHGVPDSAILLESEGRTTDQSLRAAAALMHEMARTDATDSARLTADRTAILVSDPFHMLRLGVLARRYGILPLGSPTRTSPISANTRLSWRYMLGESVKVPFVYFMEKSEDD